MLVERVLDQLMRKPYFCFFDIFYCTRSKGRKVGSKFNINIDFYVGMVYPQNYVIVAYLCSLL